MSDFARACKGCVFVFLGLTAVASHADVIDFENLPDTYMYLAGGQNIGSYFSGVTFGPNVTGLDLTGSTAFPPYTGSIAAWDAVDSIVTINFASPQTSVGLWYTSLDFLSLSAFDGASNLLGTVIGNANTDGTTGISNFLSLSASGITSITLTGSPGEFVFDDLTFTPANGTTVPEPSPLLPLLIVAGFGVKKLIGTCKGSQA